MSWLPKKSVVAPFDFSDDSLSTVDVALGLVERPEDLHVIHVLPPVADFETGFVWVDADDHTRRTHGETELSRRLADPKYDGIERTVAFGDPGSEIVAFAELKAADLIVLPSHGRTGLTRLLIGSVAERVVRMAHCPVLVLKAKAP